MGPLEMFRHNQSASWSTLRRQASSSVAVAALLCQLPPRGRAFAYDVDQAALLLDAVAGFAARTGLGSVLKIENYRVMAPNGARLTVMATDAASAWGLKGELFIVDEFCQWPTTPGPRRMWQAILGAVPKVDGCRLVLLSTTGPGAPEPRAARPGESVERVARRRDASSSPCVVVAGAFAAGALIFRGGDENVVESQLTCSDEDGDMPEDCSGYVADELEAQCVEGVDAVKITMAYEDDDGERYASRTYTEDC